jgi:hypothetical protein
MHTDIPAIPALILASEADAALRATTAQAREESVKQIAELRGDSDEGHIAAHIRGMVAATMGNMSTLASDITLEHAQQWQQWALGVADGIALPVAG